MGKFSALDIAVIIVYFSIITSIGAYFGRRTKNTEQYFVAGRSYPGWLLGISLFGATISSITFVAYPADAFRTGYLRYIICITLPFAVLIASRFFVPFYRRGKIISVFEYLEKRFGPRTRVYGATMFIISQCFRISLIQFLVALLMHNITGWNVITCILLGGVVTAFYTIAGGIQAVIWTDLFESVVLVSGGLLILGVILWKMPGGMEQVLSIAWNDRKFMLSEMRNGQLEAIPWGFSLSRKTGIMLLLVGLFQWLGEYATNQEFIQKYCSAKSARDARRAMWMNCLFCVPTWGYFMFLGTALYTFYQVFPEQIVSDMLSGARKAEEVLPYFVTTQLPRGAAGLVVAAVLAAAMSSMSAAMNSISAVVITDIYRRHLRKESDEKHYMLAARLVTLAASLVMIGGAYLLFKADTLTLQDLWSEFQSIVAGGLLGLYLLGFFTIRGDGRAVGVGILFAVLFSATISAAGLGWLPSGLSALVRENFEGYYTGIIGNLGMFTLGLCLATLFPRRQDNLVNLTVWTQDKTPLD
jgi:solute:Na+ symporter, SSS family